MASGITNLGKQRYLEWALGRVAKPASYFLHLITSAGAPTVDTATTAGLTQASNMGTAITVATNATDHDASGKDDGTDYGYVQRKDVAFTASGGDCTGRYVIATNNATWGSITEVYEFWDLGSDKTFSNGQSLTLTNLETQITPPA